MAEMTENDFCRLIVSTTDAQKPRKFSKSVGPHPRLKTGLIACSDTGQTRARSGRE